MNSRIKDKIDELNKLIDELEEIIPEDLELYIEDKKLRAASERYFERIVECVVSLSFKIVQERKLEVPDDDKTVFETLQKHNFIDKVLAERFKNAKGMRNILAHEYGKVDDTLVFEAIHSKIIPDVEDFIKQIKKRLVK